MIGETIDRYRVVEKLGQGGMGVMGQRALPLSRGLRYAEQVADALARAHAAGIVLRGIKPSNVMVTEDDTVKILDFDPATKRPRGEPFAVFHAHRSPWRTMGPRTAFSLAVGRDRLVFNAAEVTGNVLIAQLPPD